MRKHQKGAPAKKDKQPLPHERALRKLYQGPLGGLARCVGVHRDNRYPMARGDWAYVTSQGAICLNPRREASVPEWEYVLAHCMLHLGLGHLREDRLGDPLWGTACDLAVTRFLQDCRIGTPPVEFTGELPLSAKGEEQLWEQLRAMPAGKRAALGRRGAAYVEQSAGISQQAAAYLRQCRQAMRKS